jgi:serine/threonine-protein kinase
MYDARTLIGQRIGAFSVEHLLGQGGFAAVFAARPDPGGPSVALKVLSPPYADNGPFEERFRREAKVAAHLTHRSIVRILDVGRDGGHSYFTMPLYPGSVASLIEAKRTIDEQTAARIGRDVALGLAFAHERGLVHRDIKPANILIDDDGTAVIADFGIARAVSSYVMDTGAQLTIGTPQYVSPEQAQGHSLDGRSDLYALGVTLYRATTGHPPFRSTDWFELARMHVEEVPEPPRRHRPDLSGRFDRIVLRCLAKHPDHRHATATLLAAELDALV